MVATLVKLFFYSSLHSVGGGGDHESFHHHSGGIIKILYTLWGDQVNATTLQQKSSASRNPSPQAINNDRLLSEHASTRENHLLRNRELAESTAIPDIILGTCADSSQLKHENIQ